MDEILASIRRIIADDDPGQMPPKGSETQFSSPSRAADPQSDLDRPSTRAPAPRRRAHDQGRRDRFDACASSGGNTVGAFGCGSVPSGGMVGTQPTSRLPVSDGRPDRSFEDRSYRNLWLPLPPRTGEPAPDAGERGLLSARGRGSGQFRFQRAGAYGAGARRPHARGFHQRAAAANAQDLARRKSSSLVERLVRAEIERVSRGRG